MNIKRCKSKLNNNNFSATTVKGNRQHTYEIEQYATNKIRHIKSKKSLILIASSIQKINKNLLICSDWIINAIATEALKKYEEIKKK